MSNEFVDRLPKARKFRLLRVKHILESETDSEHSITMARLLELLGDESETDRRTLYEDIYDLEFLGTEVKIDTKTRPPRFSVSKRQFSLSELKLMIDAIASSKFLTMKASQELIDKLKLFCSRYEASGLNRQTLLANRAKRVDENFHNNVSIISNAIDKKKKISFEYFRINTKGKKQYNKNTSVISPWVTIYTDDKYYMVGYDGKKNRKATYRIDRMSKIDILDEQQDGEKAFKEFRKDLKFRTQSVFNMFGDEKQWVTLRAPLFFYYQIEDKFGSDLAPRIEKDKKGNEYVTVEVPVAVGPQFFAWVFGMENYITIVGPDSVVKQMKDMISKAKMKYERREW